MVGNPGRVVVKKTPRPADGVDLDQVNLPDPMLDRMEALVKRLTALEACLRMHADKLDCQGMLRKRSRVPGRTMYGLHPAKLYLF